jgi:hypothetical protein
MMRLTRWIIIVLIVLAGIWLYQRLSEPQIDDAIVCIAQGGGWDSEEKKCDLHARQHCQAKGYQWDEEGNRCLITDYQL